MRATRPLLMAVRPAAIPTVLPYGRTGLFVVSFAADDITMFVSAEQLDAMAQGLGKEPPVDTSDDRADVDSTYGEHWTTVFCRPSVPVSVERSEDASHPADRARIGSSGLAYQLQWSEPEQGTLAVELDENGLRDLAGKIAEILGDSSRR